MSSISVRSLGPNGDPLNGNGANNFLTDLDAVAQIITTRLKLFEGEWWENLTDGTPFFQSIMAAPASQKNQQVISNLLQQRISGTPFVTGLQSVNISVDPRTRALSFTCTVLTAFGPVTVTNVPASNASLNT